MNIWPLGHGGVHGRFIKLNVRKISEASRVGGKSNHTNVSM